MSASSSATSGAGPAYSGAGSVNVGGFNVPAMPGGVPEWAWIVGAVAVLYLVTKRK